jgi:hypothetical protein
MKLVRRLLIDLAGRSVGQVEKAILISVIIFPK